MKKTYPNYIHYRTCIAKISYHIIWCVKYRNKVLDDNKAVRLKEILNNIAEANGFTIESMEVGEKDRIHVFVSAPPTINVTFIVKHLKGTSAIRMFREFPELRNSNWKGQLWNSSYFVETIGSTSEENIKCYIERQGKPKNKPKRGKHSVF